MIDVAKENKLNFVGIRVRVTSQASFDDVLAKLKSAMGTASIAEVVSLASEISDASEYDRIVNERYVGVSGFMLFAEIDHGAWISLYGINRRSLRLVLGNPLIAITMIQHDLTAGLFVPGEILLTSADDGMGCFTDYVLPSSLIANSESSNELRQAASALDAKLNALISSATT